MMNAENKMLMLGAISGLAMSAADALKRAADMANVARSRGFEVPKIGHAVEEVNNLCAEIKAQAERT